jgi:predicted PurR-regulated permease PerM
VAASWPDSIGDRPLRSLRNESAGMIDDAIQPAPFLERRSDSRRLRPPTPRVGLLIVAAIVLGFVLYLGRDALSPFIVGLLFVYLLDPPVERLNRLHVPRWLAVLIVYGVALIVLVELFSMTLTPLFDQVSELIRDLPRLSKALDEQLKRLSEVYRGLDLPPGIRQAIDRALLDLGDRARSFDFSVLLPVFTSVAGLIGSLFAFLIVPVWAFYLLKDRRELTRAFDRSLPDEWRADVWAVIRISQRVFGQWVRGQFVLGVAVGIASLVGLMILSYTVDPVFGRFALLLAVIAGFFELIPFIGPVLSAIPALLLAATVSLQAVGVTLLLYFLIQQVENTVLVPKIQGDAVQLHPSAIMFALVIGGAVGGLLGVILSLPITAAGRDIYRYLFRRLSRPEPDVGAAAEAVLSPPRPVPGNEHAADGQVDRQPDGPPMDPGAVRSTDTDA